MPKNEIRDQCKINLKNNSVDVTKYEMNRIFDYEYIRNII